MKQNETFTIAQVARMIEKPEPTVRTWVFYQKLKSIKQFGRRLVKVEDLLAFLEDQNAPIPEAIKA